MTVKQFSGEYRFLSNFWPAEVDYDGLTYPTVEHAYQAAKTLDPQKRLEILRCKTAGQAKRASRGLVLRLGWEKARVSVMSDLVEQKFRRHKHLRKWLLATGDRELLEGNSWGDTFWGVDETGYGENHLGKILMDVRQLLCSEVPKN